MEALYGPISNSTSAPPPTSRLAFTAVNSNPAAPTPPAAASTEPPHPRPPPSLTNSVEPSRPDSPSNSDTPSSRRPRPVHSCDECRRKKLKCDREQPCERCVKARRGTSCQYSNVPTSALGGTARKKESSSNGAPNGETPRPSSSTSPKMPALPSLPSLTSMASKGSSAGMPLTTPPSPRPKPEEKTPTLGPPPTKRVKTHHRGDGSKSNGNTSSQSQGGVGVVEDLAERVKNLEQLMRVSRQRSSLARTDTASTNHSRNERPEEERLRDGFKANPGTVQLKGNRSRYHGINSREVIIQEFSDARGFMKELGHDNYIRSILNDVHHVLPKKVRFVPLPDMPAGDEEIIQTIYKSLPGEQSFKPLARLYFERWETVWRVLHEQSFYHDAWKFYRGDKVSDSLTSNDDFAVLLALVTVISSLLSDPGFSYEDAQVQRQIQRLMSLSQAYLDTRRGKQRLTLAFIQGVSLLLIAKRLFGAPADELWGQTGALIRSAQVLGLHRDPSEIRGIPLFEGEIRRRLWWSVVELDLQASISAGMPCGIASLCSSCRLPLNVKDEELAEGMVRLPDPRPVEMWTQSTGQLVLAMTFSTRLKAANTIAQNGTALNNNEIRRLKDEISESLARLRVRDPSSQTMPSRTLLFDAILEMLLRKPLIAITRPAAIGVSEFERSQAAEAREECIESSLAMLSWLEQLDPDVADPDLVNSRSFLDVYLRMFVNDLLQSTYILCSFILRMRHSTLKDNSMDQHRRQSISAQSPSASDMSASRSMTTKSTQPALSRTIDSSIAYLLNNYDDLALIIKDLGVLSVIHTTVRMTGTNLNSDQVRGMLRDKLIKIFTSAADRGRRENPQLPTTMAHTDGTTDTAYGEHDFSDFHGNGSGSETSTQLIDFDLDTGMLFGQDLTFFPTYDGMGSNILAMPTPIGSA